jgi:hypothetical protein
MAMEITPLEHTARAIRPFRADGKAHLVELTQLRAPFGHRVRIKSEVKHTEELEDRYGTKNTFFRGLSCDPNRLFGLFCSIESAVSDPRIQQNLLLNTCFFSSQSLDN